MQVMIFAAGKGTRLKPLTDVIPKALVPVEDIPLLQRVYRKVIEAGADKVVVNVHHHAEQIKNYCKLLEARYGVPVTISDETERLLETGGGIKKVRGEFTEPVLIHNCDILSNVDLQALYGAIGEYDALLLVSERRTSRYLMFDDAMRLIGWKNIDTGEVKSPYEEVRNGTAKNTHLYAFAGIHVINPKVFPLMDEWGDAFPIMDFYLTHCAQADFRGYLKKDLKLLDVGKLDTLEKAGEFLKII
ncbi:MAG: NTP transferase domain-containing protein [Prevotella sp.]|nr:NTP transferase domain-containing protein [Prevotella sp.]